MKIKRVIGFALWLAISFGFNYPALFANTSYISHNDPAWQAEHERTDMSVSMMFALLPIAGTVTAIFGTGFCEHGFKWKPKHFEAQP